MTPSPPQMPVRPDPPVDSPGSAPKSTLGGRVFAALGMLTATVMTLAGVLLLLMPVGYLALAIFAAAAILGLVASFHYFVWGKWLKQILEAERENLGDDP